MSWQHEWIDAMYAGKGAPAGLKGSRDAGRFDVYRASLEANLSHALADTYPVIFRLVGEAFFNQTARAYYQAHPSRSGDIHAFGADFAVFLEGLPGLDALPYLPDVAKLEWRAHEAFHAADARAITLEALVDLPEDHYSGLHLLPSLRLMRSAYPVHRIWQVNQENWTGSQRISLDEGGVNLAVCRQSLDIVLLPLEEPAFSLAGAMVEGVPLDAACEGLLATHPDADIGYALHQLVSAGLLTLDGSQERRTT